jgi:hypothetical protein
LFFVFIFLGGVGGTDCVFLCVFDNIKGCLLKIRVLAVVQLISLKTAWSDYFFCNLSDQFSSVKFDDIILIIKKDGPKS